MPFMTSGKAPAATDLVSPRVRDRRAGRSRGPASLLETGVLRQVGVEHRGQLLHDSYGQGADERVMTGVGANHVGCHDSEKAVSDVEDEGSRTTDRLRRYCGAAARKLLITVVARPSLPADRKRLNEKIESLIQYLNRNYSNGG